MLFSFTEWLGTALTARNFGGKLITVREQAGRTIPTENAIIVDRARGPKNDTFVRPGQGIGGTPGSKASPGLTSKVSKLVYTRSILCDFGIVARSTKRGATNEDHLTLLDAMIDAFLCASDEAARSHHSIFEPLNGGYLLPDGQTDDSIFAGYEEIGARYAGQFRIWRGVLDTPIQIAGASDIAHVHSNISTNGGPTEAVVVP